EPFLVMATQNPIELEGTFPLPEAQLDRFMVRIKLGYPTAEEESEILQRFERDSGPSSLEPVTDAEELRRIQEMVSTVRVDESVRMYTVQIAHATRQQRTLMLGASPRAALALYKTAQARAAIDGRDFVTPDDVKAMAASVLAHRMILTSNSRVRGHTADQAVEEVLSSVSVPIER
ncbi:MAG: MoxR family ATPase, partial [Chloroflexi bacterium]|nr:MoxR family ATPase [Chloroflexota bacterium]